MTTDKAKYQEPKSDMESTLFRAWKRANTPYETFMEEQDIPIYYGIGVYDVRQLSLGPWKRLGGRGTFIDLVGYRNLASQYVVEVPAAGALNPERHIYGEFVYVVEGRGSTEIWLEGSAKKQMFEWQAGSLFSFPINTYHRLVNASSSPALVMIRSNAPRIMEIFQSRNFIFDNPYVFREYYDENDEDFFKTRDEVEMEPTRGRAMVSSNFYPDIVHCELLLDNAKAPGYRRMQPNFIGGGGGFVGEYPSGRYSSAHYHETGAILFCLKGKGGYTYNWPYELGTRPWEDGKGHLVTRQDYIPGGFAQVGLGVGNWFHQHFPIGTDTDRFRFLAFPASHSGGGHLPREKADSQDRDIVPSHFSEKEGGGTILYRDEDPYLRKEYEATLKKEGIKFQMPESVYR